MSNKNQETIADIVDAMRNEGHTGEASCLEWIRTKMTYYADRIEEALKRGNDAKMREALKQIHDRVNSLDEECGVDPVEIRDIASAALSAPPRNCDRFINAKDALKAFERETGESMAIEFIRWLYAKAGKEETK